MALKKSILVLCILAGLLQGVFHEHHPEEAHDNAQCTLCEHQSTISTSNNPATVIDPLVPQNTVTIIYPSTQKKHRHAQQSSRAPPYVS